MKSSPNNNGRYEKDLRVRDFIYLDAALLTSFYSQVFEGTSTPINEARGAYSTTSEIQDDSGPSGPWEDSDALSSNLIDERRILHDHMFSLLESVLDDVVVDATTTGNVTKDELISSFLVRAVGKADLNDYERLGQFLDNFNSFGEALAHLQLQSDEIKSTVAALEVQVMQSTGRLKVQAQETLKQLRDPKQLALQLGIHQDGRYLKSLGLFIKFFRDNCFEIVVHPRKGNVSFRAMLDKQWLRLDPQQLRSLYRGRSDFEIVVLGQVTCVSGVSTSSKSATGATGSITSVMDHMFRASAGLENVFGEADHMEVVIRPLAIYRETVVRKRSPRI